MNWFFTILATVFPIMDNHYYMDDFVKKCPNEITLKEDVSVKEYPVEHVEIITALDYFKELNC